MKHLFDDTKLAKAKLPCGTCKGDKTVQRTIVYGAGSEARITQTCPMCQGKGYLHHHNGFPVLT